jgi:hypothetical protein
MPWTKMTEVADDVYVNNVIFTVGCERVERGKAKGGAVVGRPGTRADGGGIRHHEKRSWFSK